MMNKISLVKTTFLVVTTKDWGTDLSIQTFYVTTLCKILFAVIQNGISFMKG